MQTKKVKLEDIANITTGLPIHRYEDKGETKRQKVIGNLSFSDMHQNFKTEDTTLSNDIKDRFFSEEQDILYKVQQRTFAKEITTETGAIIPNTYIIIRIKDKAQVNSTFITYYLNDPRVAYEIERNIDSVKIIKVSTKILKELEILLPTKEEQDKTVELITKINRRKELKRKSIKCDEQLINSIYDEIIGDEYEF